jgi:hypothetical protein
MDDRPRGRAIDWAAPILGVIGSLGGIGLSAWFLFTASDRGGEPVIDFSATELKAYSVSLLVFFVIALATTVLSPRIPRASGLVLIIVGGLNLVVAVYGTLVWLFGGLLLIPFAFLLLIAGVLLITRREMTVVAR